MQNSVAGPKIIIYMSGGDKKGLYSKDNQNFYLFGEKKKCWGVATAIKILA